MEVHAVWAHADAQASRRPCRGSSKQKYSRPHLVVYFQEGAADDHVPLDTRLTKVQWI